MKVDYTYLIILLVIACMIVPVLAVDGNTTNTTTAATTAITNATPVVTTTTTVYQNVTTTPVATTTTVVPTATDTTVPVTTTGTTIVPTTQTTAIPTGDLSVASSPLGAAILIDGKYYGVTPADLTGIAPGNHIIRLTLSGYNDYEGSVYVVAGQSIPAYGTLHPMGGPSQIIVATASAPPTTAPTETTPQPAATQPTSDSALASPTVIAALIGIVTAAIGAGATIFTHKAKVPEIKTEDEPKK
jgi:hypothetical protein